MADFKILSDLAALAKAGYKPNDVKDLLELIKTNPDIETKGADDLNSGNSDKKEPEKQPKLTDEEAIAAIINREKEGQ